MTSDEIPAFMRTRRAMFQPKREDDLKPKAMAHVGETFDWDSCWVVDAEDGGPYVGQTVWVPSDGTFFGWVPDEDLVDVA